MTYACHSLAEANALDSAELLEGYYDGRAGTPEPGANRSAAYHHGWWAGASDGGHVETPTWLREIARQMVEAGRIAA